MDAKERARRSEQRFIRTLTEQLASILNRGAVWVGDGEGGWYSGYMPASQLKKVFAGRLPDHLIRPVFGQLVEQAPPEHRRLLSALSTLTKEELEQIFHNVLPKEGT